MRMIAVSGSPLPGLACLLIVAIVGCGGPSPAPMSPTPEQDPARYEQARAADEKAKQRMQEAERLLMKKSRTQIPVK